MACCMLGLRPRLPWGTQHRSLIWHCQLPIFRFSSGVFCVLRNATASNDEINWNHWKPTSFWMRQLCRKGRCTALKPTQLLIFYRDDYKWQLAARGNLYHLNRDGLGLKGVLQGRRIMIIMPEPQAGSINQAGSIISDTLRCVGASQETTVKERVAFLRMAEEGQACGVARSGASMSPDCSADLTWSFVRMFLILIFLMFFYVFLCLRT